MKITQEKIVAMLDLLVERKSANTKLVKNYIKNNGNNIDDNLRLLFKQILPYTDVSLHFSLKHNNLDSVSKIFSEYIIDNFDVVDNEYSTIHHCFLTRQEVVDNGFPDNVVKWFENIESGGTPVICRHSRGLDGIVSAREDMMEQMSKGFKPLCIFIGNIVDGVEEEYNMAKDLGIPTLEL